MFKVHFFHQGSQICSIFSDEGKKLLQTFCLSGRGCGVVGLWGCGVIRLYGFEVVRLYGFEVVRF